MNKATIGHNADILALGHLVSAFQYLEAELLRVVVDCNMSGDQRLVSILASQLSFRNLTAAFHAIVAARSQNTKLEQRTCDLAKQLDQTNEERNTFVHSHYHLMQWDGQGQFILRRKARVDLKNGYQERECWFDPKDIDALIEKMGKQCEELHDIEQMLITEGVIPRIEDSRE